jgi:hypothetical protein
LTENLQEMYRVAMPMVGETRCGMKPMMSFEVMKLCLVQSLSLVSRPPYALGNNKSLH